LFIAALAPAGIEFSLEFLFDLPQPVKAARDESTIAAVKSLMVMRYLLNFWDLIVRNSGDMAATLAPIFAAMIPGHWALACAG
jgi:hypothetical protein